MARKTKVVLVCDLHRTETEAVGTVEISIDGDRRSLDLCAEHLAEVRNAVRPWIRPTAKRTPKAASRRPKAVAKKAGGRKATAKRPKRNADAPEVRAWAIANGWDLPARGRIPSAVREAFAAR